MQPEVTLTITDDLGRSRQITIHSRRFTIGRSPDNDLIIDDVSLSRRHALIESFDGIVQLSDCGSQNGTALNGRPVTTAAVLRDGDSISIGHDCRIRVRIGSVAGALPDQPVSPDKQIEKDLPREQSDHPSSAGSKATPITIAATAIVIIILATVLGVALLRPGSDVRISRQQGGQKTENGNLGNEPSITIPEQPETRNDDSPQDAFDRSIDEAAKRLMLGVSSDKQPYHFPPEAWPDIKRKVEEYCKSNSLAGALRSVKQRGKELVARAKNNSIVLNILSYAALAKTSGGRAGDPAIVARQILPDLLYLRKTFGDKNGDGSLILVAALGMGRGQTRWHPLLNATRKMEKTTDRNVWYLHKVGKIDEPTYDFVLRFLALGIIAQDPRRFQVDADPLTF